MSSDDENEKATENKPEVKCTQFADALSRLGPVFKPREFLRRSGGISPGSRKGAEKEVSSQFTRTEETGRQHANALAKLRQKFEPSEFLSSSSKRSFRSRSLNWKKGPKSQFNESKPHSEQQRLKTGAESEPNSEGHEFNTASEPKPNSEKDVTKSEAEWRSKKHESVSEGHEFNTDSEPKPNSEKDVTKSEAETRSKKHESISEGQEFNTDSEPKPNSEEDVTKSEAERRSEEHESISEGHNLNGEVESNKIKTFDSQDLEDRKSIDPETTEILVKIQNILTKVELLQNVVETFDGTRDSKQFRYLMNSLEQCKSELDDMDIKGDEQLRTERKNVSKVVQETLTKLQDRF